MNPTPDIPSEIVSLFGEAKERSLTGTQLREILKFRLPEFNPTTYGCRGLRDYIRLHVPGVREVGRAGMDCVYALQDTAAQPPHTDGASSSVTRGHTMADPSAIWRTFASPRAEYRLYGDPSTGHLIVVPPGGETPGDAWREVPHVSAGKHVEIAKDFVGTLSSGLASRLTAQFDASEWWLPFYDEVKRLGLVTQWNAFRRERILEQMKSVLTDMGIPTTHIQSSTTAAFYKRQSSPRSMTSPAGADQGTDRLRRIAAAIVKNMSANDLRQLTVRLGDVLDVLEL